MRFHTAAAAFAASAYCVQAFKDTSPFLLWSSSPLPSRFEQRPEQLQSAGKVLGDVKEIIGECSSKIYYIIPQPSTSSSDLKTSAPHLKAAIADKSVKGRYTVSEVVGLETSSSAELVSTLVSKCGAVPMSHEAVEEGKTVFVEFENGVGELGHIDATEHSTLFKSLSHSLPYTVLYLTTPNPHPTSAPHEEMLYEPAFEEPVHMELKRQLEARIPPKTTTNDTRPLFEKYQFFTPGIFMGLLVGFVMLGLLGVGLNAISSLQVSYGAFEKEMGPSAQKKAQ